MDTDKWEDATKWSGLRKMHYDNWNNEIVVSGDTVVRIRVKDGKLQVMVEHETGDD